MIKHKSNTHTKKKKTILSKIIPISWHTNNINNNNYQLPVQPELVVGMVVITGRWRITRNVWWFPQHRAACANQLLHRGGWRRKNRRRMERLIGQHYLWHLSGIWQEQTLVLYTVHVPYGSVYGLKKQDKNSR